jgi:glycosyltransferase involved in cell wall biosynthesis
MGSRENEQGIEHDRSSQSAPVLSVTVLNYNYAHYLPQCLDSILRQTWRDFELLLINDRSTDNSLEVIQPYLCDPRVRLIDHEQNKGYIASLIEGSALSRGNYLTVISADDYCVSERAFETLLDRMQANEQIAFAYSAYGHYDNDGNRALLVRPYRESRVRAGVEEYRELIMENHILHSGVIIRATAYQAVGGYDASVRYACDALMWLRLCGKGKVAYSADELYAYRWHGSNMSDSRDATRLGTKEHLDAIESTFALMRSSYGLDNALFTRAIRRSISTIELSRMYAGHVGLAWYALWCAARQHPVLALVQRSTLDMLAYTLLGRAVVETLRRIAHGSPLRLQRR